MVRVSLAHAGPVRHAFATMAGAMAVSSGKPGKRYNAKVTGYVWFLCLIGGSGGLLLGYDNGIIGKRRYELRCQLEQYCAALTVWLCAVGLTAWWCRSDVCLNHCQEVCTFSSKFRATQTRSWYLQVVSPPCQTFRESSSPVYTLLRQKAGIGCQTQ